MSTLALTLAVGSLGGIAALARFWIDAAVAARFAGSFPLATFAVNASGAFALGFATGIGVGGPALALVATGLIGSFTTFSTWIFESQRLIEHGSDRAALLNLVLSLVVGLAGAAAGYLLGRRL